MNEKFISLKMVCFEYVMIGTPVWIALLLSVINWFLPHCSCWRGPAGGHSKSTSSDHPTGPAGRVPLLSDRQPHPCCGMDRWANLLLRKHIVLIDSPCLCQVEHVWFYVDPKTTFLPNPNEDPCEKEMCFCKDDYYINKLLYNYFIRLLYLKG